MDVGQRSPMPEENVPLLRGTTELVELPTPEELRRLRSVDRAWSRIMQVLRIKHPGYYDRSQRILGRELDK